MPISSMNKITPAIRAAALFYDIVGITGTNLVGYRRSVVSIDAGQKIVTSSPSALGRVRDNQDSTQS